MWSVILHADTETFCVTVASFQGVQTPPYNGDSRVDSRDLFYDSRGWWKHAHAVKTTAPVGPGRLHRLSRGLSASGLPWRAGSLNEALGGGWDEAPGSEGDEPDSERETAPTDLPGNSVAEAQRNRARVGEGYSGFARKEVQTCGVGVV